MLPTSKAMHGWLRVLWVCAAVSAAVLAVNPGLWHGDGAERHCAVCHISNLPVVQPAAAIHIERPAETAWHSPAEQLSSNTRTPLISISGRAPPA
jgi:hypothetical protein